MCDSKKKVVLLIAVLGLLAAGCDDDDGNGAPGSDAGADAGSGGDAGGPSPDGAADDGAVACPDLMPAGDATFPIISEVRPGEYVEVFNPTDATFTFASGDQVCQFPSYTAMSGLTDRTDVAAGGYVVLDWPAGWSTADAELALYTDIVTPATDFADASKIRDYVCWGGHSGGRMDVAASAGIWSGDCVASPGGEESLHRIAETDGTGAASYEAGPPSMLECTPQ
ncbi:MAG: hypothetical protein ACOC97_04420 [Myxococcota bacterium]